MNWFLLFICFFSFLSYGKARRPFPLNKTLIQKIKKQGGALVSDRVGDYILRAEDLADRKKYKSAIEFLEYHYQRESFSKTEKAQFASRLGFLYHRNKNESQALSYLQKALDFKTLNYHEHLSVLYYMALIHTEKGRYKKALKLLQYWFSINENPNPSAYILLAHCYYNQNQLDKALKFVEMTISFVREPRESWLQFATAIHLKRKNFEKAQPYLEQLVALYPSRSSHWKQLAGVYLYLDETKKAFVTLDMANKMGHLKSKSDYLNLSSLYMDQGLPYQGAKLLKQKINQGVVPKDQKNLEILAEAFWMAREGKESLLYLEQASKTAEEPLFFVKYGQKLLDQEKWQSAEKAFRKALNTKQMNQTIKEIKDYKKNLALRNKKENDLRMSAFFKSQEEKGQNNSSFFFNESQNVSKDSSANKAFGESSSSQKEESSTQNNFVDNGSIETQIKSDKLSSEQLTAPSTNNLESTNTEKLQPPPTNNLENIYLGLGIALYQQEKYKPALSYFKKSIEVNDTFLSGYQWIDYTETAILDQQKKQVSEDKEETASKKLFL